MAYARSGALTLDRVAIGALERNNASAAFAGRVIAEVILRCEAISDTVDVCSKMCAVRNFLDDRELAQASSTEPIVKPFTIKLTGRA